MSQTKHTPGPWMVRDTGAFLRIGAGPLSTTVAHHIVNEANARLIAAAPDLLAALEAALQVAGPHRWWHDDARAAIAKARGE